MDEQQPPAPFTDALYAMPALWGRLLAEHIPDPTGRRCQACTTAGTGSPGANWPCRIRDVAEGARLRYATANGPRQVTLRRNHDRADAAIRAGA